MRGKLGYIHGIHEVMIYSNCKRFSVIFQHIKFYIVPVHNVLDFIF